MRFHWVLALLSKRSLHALTTEERESLRRTSAELGRHPDDEWKRALEVVFGLLRCVEGTADNADTAIKGLRTLPRQQHDQILRHLDMVLSGGVKESLWAETCRAAEKARTSEDRTERVWAYFEPDPIPPRVRDLYRSVPPSDYAQAGAWSALFLTAVCFNWFPLLATADPRPVLSFLLALASGYSAARSGFFWYYNQKRLWEKERDHAAPPRSTSPPEHGFANQIDHLFEHYFAKYRPVSIGRDAWLTRTAGIRRTLRNETVELYRESRVKAERIEWLIRYLARDVRRRWQSGTLLEHRERYKVATASKTWCVLSSAVAAAAVITLTVTAFQTHPFTAALTTLLASVSAWFAVPLWTGVASTLRRRIEDKKETERIREERSAEYHRWKKKLDDIRPTEKEMELWLNSDRTVILDQVLRHHRLKWHDIISHFFLLSPGRPCKQKREKKGQWRYSRYEIRVFLITEEGVREVVVDLDYQQARSSIRERYNFRFDAISSVFVEEDEKSGIALTLTLMDGTSKEITSPREEPFSYLPEEDPEDLFRGNLDASGFSHSMRLLEGIAAEGKGWVERLPGARDPARSSR
ncbi:hypothetical protein [Thermobifida halotolerans]|uniref:hypothetical protein n=1 Tax=Thermobifida halotolerans TaxID=483545 RepID=UPI0012F4EAC4|nr:hypothetical protein [Thermobifida halotolerans]